MLGVLEAMSYIATVLGIPGAFIVWQRQRRRDRETRYREAYASVDAAYMDFLKTCLDHPDIDILREDSDIREAGFGEELSLAEKRRTWILYTMLINTMEHAFLTFEDSPSSLHAAQWAGWERWALDYFRLPACRAVWDRIGTSFDARFYKYFSDALDKNAEARGG